MSAALPLWAGTEVSEECREPADAPLTVRDLPDRRMRGRRSGRRGSNTPPEQNPRLLAKHRRQHWTAAWKSGNECSSANPSTAAATRRQDWAVEGQGSVTSWTHQGARRMVDSAVRRLCRWEGIGLRGSGLVDQPQLWWSTVIGGRAGVARDVLRWPIPCCCPRHRSPVAAAQVTRGEARPPAESSARRSRARRSCAMRLALSVRPAS